MSNPSMSQVWARGRAIGAGLAGAALSITLATGVGPVCAADGLASSPDLPVPAQASAALEASSMVRIARLGIDVESANRQRLAVGPYEASVRGMLGRRSDPALTYRDTELVIERPVRLGDKARLDQRIGEAGVEIAKLSVTDARHEAGRLLLRYWFALQRARAEATLWDEQTALLERQLDVAQRRVRAGDAPRADILLAQAALAQAAQARAQAQARVRTAAAELSQDFPTLSLPEGIALAQPESPGADEDSWRVRILQHNHELLVASAQTAQARRVAERVRADRRPDPTVGVRYATERSGADHVVGVVLSMPIAGAAREAALTQALAHAALKAEHEAAVSRRVGGAARTLFRSAIGAWETWEKAELAASQLARHAELAARGYALGEGTLNDVLLARRAANESRLAAAGAQAQAQEARFRLALDAHALWPLDED